MGGGIVGSGALLDGGCSGRSDREASIGPRRRHHGLRLRWEDQCQAAEVGQYLEAARREYGVPGA